MKFVEDIKTNLGKLPETLEDTYSQIWNEILSDSPFSQKISKRALMWVMCAREPFNRELWAEASYYPESVPESGIDILFDLCRNLVAWNTQLGCVIFAHLSVQEYLENRIFTSADANSMAAKSCLSWFNPNQLPKSRNGYTLFAMYSIAHWPYHVELIEREMLKILQPFLGTYANPSEAYTIFLEATCNIIRVTTNYCYFMDKLGWFPHVYSTPPNPLFLMCYFHFGVALREQLKCDSVDIDRRNSMGQTALCVASMRGNELEMDLLLERMVGGNATAHASLNAQKEAIKSRQPRALAKLLDCGISVGAHGNRLENLLRTGAGFGNLEMMKAIMERHANIKISERVMTAAAGNDKQVIEYLLARDSNIKITEAVLTAAARNKKQVLGFLLARDPDIMITEAVLVAAAAKRDGNEVLEILLARDPNIKITAAVLVVAVKNAKEVVELLLTSDHDIKISEAVLATAAATCDGGDVFEFLLARDPNIKMTEAVLTAAAGNEGRVTRLLLARDPDIKITEAVLTAAAKGCDSDEVFKLLLTRDPCIKIPEAVLMEVVASNGEEAFEFLLSRDPDIKITEAILTAAVKNGWSEEVIWPLLAVSANIEILEVILARNSSLRGIFMDILLRARQGHIIRSNAEFEITHRGRRKTHRPYRSGSRDARIPPH